MVAAGKVYATATEDMDALTFGSPIIVRHLTFSEARKISVQEIHLNKVLNGMELSQNEVVYLIITEIVIILLNFNAIENSLFKIHC